jgi:hypothetical protein
MKGDRGMKGDDGTMEGWKDDASRHCRQTRGRPPETWGRVLRMCLSAWRERPEAQHEGQPSISKRMSRSAFDVDCRWPAGD